MTVYNPNIPQPTDIISASQSQLLGNFQYLNGGSTPGTGTFGLNRDHFLTGSNANSNDGTHKQVTLTNEANPGFTGGNSVLYAKAVSAVSQLFFNNGSDIQLTGPSTLSPSGLLTLPGGVIFQWGVSPGASTTTDFTVTFPTPFPNNAFFVTFVIVDTSHHSSYGVVLQRSSLTVNQFVVFNGGGRSVQVSWLAIGN